MDSETLSEALDRDVPLEEQFRHVADELSGDSAQWPAQPCVTCREITRGSSRTNFFLGFSKDIQHFF